MAPVGGISAIVVRLYHATVLTIYSQNGMAPVGGISATVVRLTLTRYIILDIETWWRHSRPIDTRCYCLNYHVIIIWLLDSCWWQELKLTKR